MAKSKCPYCQNEKFELKEVTPSQSNFILNFVQCSSCGAPFGITEARNTTAMLKHQNDAIKKIAKALKINVKL